MVVQNVDEILRSLQTSRNAADDKSWSQTWWGAAAKKLKRRAESADDCKIMVTGSKGKFPILKFTVQEGKQSIYGVQHFYLRNQWRSENVILEHDRSYWYNDAGSSWMQGAFDTDHFQKLISVYGDLYYNASDEQRLMDATCKPGTIRYFNKEEKDAVAEFVLPTVRELDEVFSREGRSAEECGFKITKKHGKEKEVRVQRALKLKVFKALQLLDIEAV